MALPSCGLVVCIGLSVLAWLFSSVLTTLLYGIEDLFEHLPLHWMWWPALGGIAVGIGGLVGPRALGVGYDVIADLLNGHLLLHAVVLILGGATGWCVGYLLPVDPGFWAMLGMAAMLGGTSRNPARHLVM